MKLFRLYRSIYILLLLLSVGCKKLVEIPQPVDTLTTIKVFSTEANANTAVAGIYYRMTNISNGIGPSFNGMLTLYPSLSADELSTAAGVEYYYFNNAIPTSEDKFWGSIYGVVYDANAVIEGLEASEALTESVKTQFIGEAKFIRAFCYYYLVNLFGEVPVVLTTEFAANSSLPRTTVSKVYEQVIEDLKQSKELLAGDFSISGGERIRANKFAASALLARVYLTVGRWADAEIEAGNVLNNANFSLQTDLNAVFIKNNNEAIFQLQIVNTEPYATFEGFKFVPEFRTRDYDSATIADNLQYFVPAYSLQSGLINAFEFGDHRKLMWLESTGPLNGINYYYPYKYKVRKGSSPADITEYNTALRLAEQYLIRAEARAQQNNLDGAVSDINIIRARAGLGALPSSLTQPEVLAAVMQENRIELCLEWGHRWFDLKRTGKANEVLSTVKEANWQTSDQLYPIPGAELLLNPNLSQNEGYPH